jgi:hypothetical protein
MEALSLNWQDYQSCLPFQGLLIRRRCMTEEI